MGSMLYHFQQSKLKSLVVCLLFLKVVMEGRLIMKNTQQKLSNDTSDINLGKVNIVDMIPCFVPYITNLKNAESAKPVFLISIVYYNAFFYYTILLATPHHLCSILVYQFIYPVILLVSYPKLTSL